MNYTSRSIQEVISEYVNQHTFLPAIQRELVWNRNGIEKLFDSIMCQYPISSFLFWKVKQENKDKYPVYEFIKNYDEDSPHNSLASMNGINQDVFLVLDGQQRLTSLYIGLKGTFTYFYYRSIKTKLYLNLFKPIKKSENPEELTYQFLFKEDDSKDPNNSNPQYWYLVGNILDFRNATEARLDIRKKLTNLSIDNALIDNAEIVLDNLHNRIFTETFISFYEVREQEYETVLDIFIRANTGGIKLEYSDVLLSTATAKWGTLNARQEINRFTDDINATGSGYSFGKDFVLKGCLYLTDNLPIQYKLSTFTNKNLLAIENNWISIQKFIQISIDLISKFGFNNKNIFSQNAVLVLSYYLKKLNRQNFVDSSERNDVSNQLIMQKWLALVLIKNIFGGSSDTTLKICQDTINKISDVSVFPFREINNSLNIEQGFTKLELDKIYLYQYGSRYSYLVLSLLYPDRDWKGKVFHEDHIFPKSEFSEVKLAKRGYDESKINKYRSYFNTVLNLQLLTVPENLEKHASPFDKWFEQRDSNFKERHFIPTIKSYNFDNFLEFIEEREKLIAIKLKSISIDTNPAIVYSEVQNIIPKIDIPVQKIKLSKDSKEKINNQENKNEKEVKYREKAMKKSKEYLLEKIKKITKNTLKKRVYMKVFEERFNDEFLNLQNKEDAMFLNYSELLNSNLKIGQKAQDFFNKLVADKKLILFFNKNSNLKIQSFPILIEVTNKTIEEISKLRTDGQGRSRYYAEPISENDRFFLLCSQWYEQNLPELINAAMNLNLN